jgi:hypothetical protein
MAHEEPTSAAGRPAAAMTSSPLVLDVKDAYGASVVGRLAFQ